MQENISRIMFVDEPADAYFNQLDPSLWIVDVREEGDFKKGHLPHAVNLMASGNWKHGSAVLSSRERNIISLLKTLLS